MIAIITEKPSVGHDIARFVGATEKQPGYFKGNGYLVTWAFGHLVQLAPPEFYGYRRGREGLPVIPDPFALNIRKTKTGGKVITDSAASRQMNVIARVLDQCQSIIVATDAGREGELIFRFIYDHLKCTLPFKRLWISSLTDEAILEGLDKLRDGRQFNNLYRAADCRAKADWLVGMNASNALAAVSGNGNNSLGRVQTPTLALVCSRFLENRRFLPSDYWQLHATAQKGDKFCKFRLKEDIRDKARAESLSAKLKEGTELTVSRVEKNRVKEAPPLLYDLTALQKDCNVHYDMTADRTLTAAQSLYEKKLISYPRTGSRYIPRDMMRHIPSLLRMCLRMERFKHFEGGIDPVRPALRSVDDDKITDHHALIITGNYHDQLTPNEERVYFLIAGRMLEAFAPKCEKDTMLIEATLGDMLFLSRSTEVVTPGWRGVYNRPEERGEDDEDMRATGLEFAEGEALPVHGHSLFKRKTRPNPLYTEATLLAAMETAGKHIADEQAREAMKDSGLGTPATRAGIIETLVRRDYIERSGKSLVPTDKGLYIYNAVRDMRIADVELTGNWEKSLASIEKGEMPVSTFMKAIEVYARQITGELLSLDLKIPEQEAIKCPKCGSGNITIRHKIAKCDNEKCGLVVYRKFLNKQLTDQHVRQLLSSGKTRLIKGFKGKQQKTFDARLAFDKNFNLTFCFPEKKGAKSTGAKGKGKPKPKSKTSKPSGSKAAK